MKEEEEDECLLGSDFFEYEHGIFWVNKRFRRIRVDKI